MAKHLLQAVTNGNFSIGPTFSDTSANFSENQAVFYCCNNKDGKYSLCILLMEIPIAIKFAIVLHVDSHLIESL